MKRHVVYRKGTLSADPGSSPHALSKLCNLGHGLHWTSVFPSEEWEIEQIYEAWSLEISNRVVVG